MPGNTTPQVVVGTQWWLLSLSLIFVLARLYARIFKLHKNPFLADYIVVIAWIANLCCAALTTIIYLAGIFENDALNNSADATGRYNGSVDEDSIDDVVKTLKMGFAIAVLNDVGLYFPKFSLLAFYFLWISAAAFPKLRKALYVVTAWVYTSCLACFLLDFLWVIPVSDNWSVKIFTLDLTLKANDYRSTWALNLVSDLMVFLLPFFLLRYLRFGRREFYAALGVFLLGLITILTTVAREVAIAVTMELSVVSILFAVEFNVSIIVVCLPSLKPLFNNLKKPPRSQSLSTSGSGVTNVVFSNASLIHSYNRPGDTELQDVRSSVIVLDKMNKEVM